MWKRAINWKEPLYFLDTNERAFVKRWGEERVALPMPSMAMPLEDPIPDIEVETRTVVEVDDAKGRLYRYTVEGEAIGHTRDIANTPFDVLQAEARREISRAQAKRRLQRLEDAAGDLYGLF